MSFILPSGTMSYSARISSKLTLSRTKSSSSIGSNNGTISSSPTGSISSASGSISNCIGSTSIALSISVARTISILSIAFCINLSANFLSSGSKSIKFLVSSNSRTIGLSLSLAASPSSSVAKRAFISPNIKSGLLAASFKNTSFFTAGSFISASAGN